MKKYLLSFAFIIFVFCLSFFSSTKTPYEHRWKGPLDVAIDVKEIIIPGKRAFNPSIISKEEGMGYYCVFRFDDKKSHIGLIDLNENFSPDLTSFREILTSCIDPHDPRIFRFEKDYYILFNSIPKLYQELPNKFLVRHMYLAKVNMPTAKCDFVTYYDLHLQRLEKNWMPFVYKDEKGKENLFFVYQMLPHKILQISDTSLSNIQQPIFLNDDMYRPIDEKWGIPRGGTPVVEVDGEYLAFFHSCIRFNKKRWYIIGAYTFENKPPFRITKISKYPIVAKSLQKSNILFPCSFATGKKEEKDVIYLSIGENDQKMKIVTLDKERLLSVLEDVKK